MYNNTDPKQTTTATATRTTKDLIGRTIVQHVRLKLCTFLSRPMQNNNVKPPQFASSANRNRDGKFFKFPFGAQRFFYKLC